jgi:hypothetical protein
MIKEFIKANSFLIRRRRAKALPAKSEEDTISGDEDYELYLRYLVEFRFCVYRKELLAASIVDIARDTARMPIYRLLVADLTFRKQHIAVDFGNSS